jgi:hypothetical protein
MIEIVFIEDKKAVNLKLITQGYENTRTGTVRQSDDRNKAEAYKLAYLIGQELRRSVPGPYPRGHSLSAELSCPSYPYPSRPLASTHIRP